MDGLPGIRHFARFGVTETMIAQALSAALSRGGDHADVFFQHRVSSSVGVEDGAVNRAHASVDLGVGVRVVRGDQTGYGYTEDLSLPAILECARTAAAIADGPARPGPARFHVDGDLPDRYPLVRPWEEIRPEEKLPLVAALNERAFAADPRVRKVNVYLADEAGAILVADSRGRIVEDSQPMTLLYLSVVAEQDGRREQNGYNVAGRAGFDFYGPERLDRVVREAISRTVVLFEAGPPPAGEMPVVLAAGSSGILLHEAIGHGMEADFNRKGISIYADKIGKRIARPFVQIVDDAANQGARGAINVDDEGNAAGTTRLVEDGVLATY
ncbi:MAG TPA: TldD/PmbA family protein, partial [Anaeromyxobacteraceae bacterium]|nr:TldD/PmbA family protein [Anaeromyxobacteraceae bacterium]